MQAVTAMEPIQPEFCYHSECPILSLSERQLLAGYGTLKISQLAAVRQRIH